MAKSVDESTVIIDSLKEKHPNGSLIQFEDGEWAFFKKPKRKDVGLAMSKSRTNPLAMVDVIVANCLVDSSTGCDLKSDDGIGYLMGLAEKIDEIIGTKKAEIKN